MRSWMPASQQHCQMRNHPNEYVWKKKPTLSLPTTVPLCTSNGHKDTHHPREEAQLSEISSPRTSNVSLVQDLADDAQSSSYIELLSPSMFKSMA